MRTTFNSLGGVCLLATVVGGASAFALCSKKGGSSGQTLQTIGGVIGGLSVLAACVAGICFAAAASIHD